MRAYFLLAGLVCLGLIGCASLPNSLNEISMKTNVASDRIVLIAKAHQPGGGSATQHHWVIEKDGPSQGTMFFGEKGFEEGATTAFKLPADIHALALGKIQETQFFDMKSATVNYLGIGRFGPHTASIEIHYRGRKHLVTQTDHAVMDDGFNKLWLFIGDVQKQSTVMTTKSNPGPPYGKRTADQPGVGVAGLSPAGPTP